MSAIAYLAKVWKAQTYRRYSLSAATSSSVRVSLILKVTRLIGRLTLLPM